MNAKEVSEAVKAVCENTKLCPVVIGRHGIGKSETMEILAKQMGMRFVSLRLGSVQDVGDLLGLQIEMKDKNGETSGIKFVPPDWFPKEGEKIFLFLDEFNRARKDLQSTLFQLSLDKTLHTHKLTPGSFVVLACNPATDDYSTIEIDDKAMSDRFVFLKYDPTPKDWVDYMKEVNPSSTLVSFIKEVPEQLGLGLTEDFSLDFVQPSPRTITELDKIFEKVKKDEINIETFKNIAFGSIGITSTLTFIKWYETESNRVTGKEILKNPKKFLPKVKELVEKNKMDTLNEIIEDVIKINKENELDLKQFEVVKQLCLTVPRPLSFKLLKTITFDVGNPEVIRFFWHDSEIEKYFELDSEFLKEIKE